MTKNPQAAIIMGSDSDLPVMSEAAKVLEQFKIVYELTILSAHRTPQKMFKYAKSAKKKGIKVIIAGAGGAAHLPGMTASLTTLPVIGVPIKTTALSGVDSLYSIVQMPKGIPVATVAINNAFNAGLLTVSILAIKDKVLEKKLIEYKKTTEKKVIKKAQKLGELGFKKYLSSK